MSSAVDVALQAVAGVAITPPEGQTVASLLDVWRQSELMGMDGERAVAGSTDSPAATSAPKAMPLAPMA